MEIRVNWNPFEAINLGRGIRISLAIDLALKSKPIAIIKKITPKIAYPIHSDGNNLTNRKRNTNPAWKMSTPVTANILHNGIVFILTLMHDEVRFINNCAFVLLTELQEATLANWKGFEEKIYQKFQLKAGVPDSRYHFEIFTLKDHDLDWNPRSKRLLFPSLVPEDSSCIPSESCQQITRPCQT